MSSLDQISKQQIVCELYLSLHIIGEIGLKYRNSSLAKDIRAKKSFLEILLNCWRIF